MHFTVHSIDYKACPGFGPDHILSRIASGSLDGFPLLRSEIPSAFMQKTAPDKPREPLYVIGGQQPCLLTGPLYTVLKAATTVHLARSLSELWNRPVLPCFWNASEDHDIMEVNRTTLKGSKFVCPYQGPLKRGQVPPVGSIPLAGERRRIIDAVTGACSGEPFLAAVTALLEKARYDTYGTFFSDLIGELFKPRHLETVEPSQLREKTSPVLATLVENWPETKAAFQKGSEKVQKAGFKPPLASLIFFEIVNGKRTPVTVEGNRFHLSSGTCTCREAAARIRDRPHDFSPGAALRPPLQDTAFSVAATVAGPSEILYLWQIREIYSITGTTPSFLFPRLSTTFITGGIEKKVHASGRSLSEMFSLLYNIEKQIKTLSSPEIEAAEAAFRELDKKMLQAQTPSNAKWFSRNRRSLEKMFSKTVKRLRRETVAPEGELKKMAETLFPRHRLQERTAGIFDFLGLYGPEWIDHLCNDLDPWQIDHKVVTIIQNNE